MQKDMSMEAILPVPHESRQEELIRDYCEEADALLSTAQDYPSAVRMKQSLCARFQEECDSALVVSAASQFIDNVLKKRWGITDGENRTLQEH